MNKCCTNQTTAFCGDCGTDLRANSLVGLKAYLENRVKAAQEILDKWTAVNPKTLQSKQGIARNTRNVEQLQGWLDEVADILADRATPEGPETT